MTGNNHRDLNIPNSKYGKFVRKMRIEPNMIIAFTQGAITSNGLQALAEEISRTGIPGVTLLVVKDVNDMRNLSEKDMNDLGWFKVDTLKRAIKAAREAPEAGETEEGGKDEQDGLAPDSD
jgi:hypothetical protein